MEMTAMKMFERRYVCNRMCIILLLIGTKAAAFSQPGVFLPSVGVPMSATFDTRQARLTFPTSSKLCARAKPIVDNVACTKMERPHKLTTFWTYKRAPTVVMLTLLATISSTAFPAISNAIDLDNIVGGAVATGATTNGLISRLAETGFYQAFSLVFLSEIGDKTFFVAGLLAMKTTKFVSFLGSMGALGTMTILATLIGQIFHVVPAGLGEGVPLDDIAACIAFAFFGLKTLKEALDMEEGESAMDEELAEAQETVSENSALGASTGWAQIAGIFALVFAAEFGDRSFLSTIALSAAQDPISVCVGAIAAHGVATGIAVSGGAYIAKYVSERVIGIIGGTLFLVFAATTALGIF